MIEKEKRIEELKQKAKALGYRLTPIQKYIRFKPCICGRKYPSMWHNGDYTFYKCPRCGRAAHNAKSEREARIKWNEMVTRKQKED